MAKNIKLTAVATPPVGANVLHLENSPFLMGKERTNLVCGTCGLVLCKGVSKESCLKKFSAPVQLLVRCPQCRTPNQLPAQLES